MGLLHRAAETMRPRDCLPLLTLCRYLLALEMWTVHHRAQLALSNFHRSNCPFFQTSGHPKSMYCQGHGLLELWLLSS